MKKSVYLISLFIVLMFTFCSSKNTFSQDKRNVITQDLLYKHVSYLASEELEGRLNGGHGLELAQEYIAEQVKSMGLKPGNGDSYFQPYPVIETSYTQNCFINTNGRIKQYDGQSYQIVPTRSREFDIKGNVVFAGYGIVDEQTGYNDFKNVNVKDKIVLIIAESPKDKNGEYIYNDYDATIQGINAKYDNIVNNGAKGVIIVPAGKDENLIEKYPILSRVSRPSVRLASSDQSAPQSEETPIAIIADRSLADALLKNSGYTLDNLQKAIDTNLKPRSFSIQGTSVQIEKKKTERTLSYRNVVAILEGSDPSLKDEYVIFSGHADHVGISAQGKVCPGADDNASGCAGLLAIAKAFKESKKQPKRSILFIWVSGEEIGLYGSASYAENPLVPFENTVADINIDMIGRSETPADTLPQTQMSGPRTVFVITGNQSSELSEIAEKIDKKSVIDFDYSLSGRDHPQRIFYRSDHYNFAKNDIPALFFFTGQHSDYHSPDDTIDKVDFEKMQLITQTIYQIGKKLVNQKHRIVVDNPMSSWTD